MKLEHAITLPTGERVTRTSTSRRYSHAIIIRETEERRAKLASHYRDLAAKRRAKIADPAAGYAAFRREYPSLLDDARYGTLEAWKAGVETEVAEAEKTATAYETRELGNWYVDGWASRPDLAEKAAGKVRARAFEARIIPVETIREIKPRAPKAVTP